MNIRNRKKDSAALPRNARRQTRSTRRGILLLVVLSLLTLFLMIGMAFIVTANQFRRTNKAYAKTTAAAHAPTRQGKLLDEVLNQVVRDTNNPNSTLRYHSLLRDLYGNDGVKIGPSTIPSVRFADRSAFSYTDDLGNVINSSTLDTRMSGIGNQFFWVAVQFDLPVVLTPPQLPPLRTTDNYYNGNLLTFTDGGLRDTTARIVGYDYQVTLAPTTTNVGTAIAVFTLLPLDASEQIVSQTLTSNNVIGTQDRAIINGRPFNGTGAGYNPNPSAPAGAARLSTTELVSGTNRPLALLPNSMFFDFNSIDTTGPGTFGAYYSSQWSTLPLAQQQQLIAKMGPVGLGGSDESYDAPDFQNMALAMLPVGAVETVLLGQPAEWPNTNPPSDWPASLPTSLGNVVLPSFHRPALINYWRANSGSSLAADPNLLRKILLRPNWFDHPNFSGSNPDLEGSLSSYRRAVANNSSPDNYSDQLLIRTIYGPWDVDNDNDGVRDSVWIDFGSPVMQGPNGRLVKPMAAVLMLDMDGRLNLNAHGTRDLAGLGILPTAKTLAGGTMSSTLARGQGYGPAEISLQPVVGNRFQALLQGVFKGNSKYGGGAPFYDRTWAGRYGLPGDSQPGISGTFDLIAQMKMQGLPTNGNGKLFGGTTLAGYATPPDFLGRYALGLNNFGQPAFETIDDSGNIDTTVRLDRDTPYELDLSAGAIRGQSDLAADGPFGMDELERIMRAYDVDAGTLSPRLWELANGFFQNAGDTTPNLGVLNQWRTLLTTDSYDMPVPSVVVPEWMQLGPDGASSGSDDYQTVMGKPPVQATFSDLLEYRLRLKGLTGTVLKREMAKLLSPDLADGLRLDINRALGNGRDDNNNGVVDEPGEWDDVVNGNNNGKFDNNETEAAYWKIDRTVAPPAGIDITAFEGFKGKMRDEVDRDGNGVIIPRERGDADNSGTAGDTLAELVEIQNFRRQLLARHLYVLAMTLVDPLPTTATAIDRAARARRLAQWAINIIDFRDPDNCMTAFEYDAEPFDGWAVDGDLATSVDIYGSDLKFGGTGVNTDPGGLVWGAERPELLITETMAWHDRRTEDQIDEEPNVGEQAKSVEDATNPDQDFDQRLRPRGAGFVELYNPWSANPAANADTHRKNNTGQDLGIDLAKVATGTDSSGNTVESPVWRLAVYRNARTNILGGGGISYVPPQQAALLDPDSPDPNARPNLMDRCIYFCDFDPRMTNSTQVDLAGTSTGVKRWDNDRGAFFQANAVRTTMPLEQKAGPCVRPSSYMMVCSGDDFDGDGIYQAPIGDLNPLKNGTILRRIEMEPGNTTNPFRFIEPKGTNNFSMPQQGSRSVCDIALITSGSDGTSTTGVSRRFTFSEPSKGYRNKVKGSWWSASGNPTGQGWYAYGNDTSKPYPIDTPLDNDRSDITFKNNLDRYDDSNRDLMKLGTTPGYRWVYLQRLANPLLPWNPEPFLPDGSRNPNFRRELAVNPYFTIDVSSVNLTVFNGREVGKRYKNQGQSGNEIINASPHNNSAARSYFASVERGNTNAATDINKPVSDRRLSVANQQTAALGSPWTPENPGFTRNGNGGSGEHFFNASPVSTLGFLTAAFDSGDRITPNQPFPWLAWNNRPFVSSQELMLVPRSRPSQLLREFSSVRSSPVDPYKKSGVPSQAVAGAQSLQGQFGHLPNLFLTETPGTSKLPDVPAGLFRVLEFVQVPSRFVGTETWLNPATFGDVSTPVNSPSDPRFNRQPPFNRISSYREPGRVNLNTMVSADVWDGGLLHRQLIDNTSAWNSSTNNYLPNTGHVGPLFVNVSTTAQGILESRRGYVGVNLTSGMVDAVLDRSLLPLDPNVPTFFANPFRSSDAGNLVPLPQLRRAGADCQELRSNKLPQITQANGVLNTATTGPTLGALKPSNTPLMAASTTTPYNNTARNPYFRYQPMTRLANLTTTRSNVYAIWITIGFFEVEEAPDWNDPDTTVRDALRARFGGTSNDTDPATIAALALYNRVYPDGFQLSKEAGIDTGDIQRIREFAVIDRTIPVAFEPGKNHNVERAIRLRRRIE